MHLWHQAVEGTMYPGSRHGTEARRSATSPAPRPVRGRRR